MKKISIATGIFAVLVSRCLGATTVTVSASASHPVPTSLFGQMYEDISHSGDGGLYAELLQNRAFQKVTPNTAAALNAWHPIKGSIAVIADPAPVSSALPNSLQLTIPSGLTGPVGFSNEGYWGIKVDSTWTYTASFYYKFPATSKFNGNLAVGLQSSTGQVFATTNVAISGSQTTWKQVTVTLKPNTTPSSTANSFTITLDGAAASGQKINFAMLSLFPPTYKNRANGMRIDIATTLADMKPKFFRLPGGNNLEGESTDTRWVWNATVGPLVDRPGRMGDWSYINTDGLGLLEYLYWCEDLGAEPIMAVWAGYSLRGTSVPENQLGPYIQAAIDQINFVVGDPAKSAAAQLRAKLGRSAPFALKYVEVGNEDFFAASTYPYRWKDIVSALSAQFPNIRFIATAATDGPTLTPKPKSWDVHVYQTPSWFPQNSFFYDSFARDGTTYFEGEYAAISTNSSDIFGSPANGRLVYPTIQSAVNEAAFMTGLERNSDIVFAASYAPLLGHVSGSQWTPNLVSFDAGTVYQSTSFYVQKLFSLNSGDSYYPSTLPSKTGTLFWSVVRRTATNELILKVVNIATNAQDIKFVLPFKTVASTGSVQVVTGKLTDSNTPSSPKLVQPKSSMVSTSANFVYNAPALSVSVITVVAQ